MLYSIIQLLFYVIGLPMLATLIVAVLLEIAYYQAAIMVGMHFAALAVYAVLMASYNILRTITFLKGDSLEIDSNDSDSSNN